MQVFPGLCVFWDVEIGVLEVYGCCPFLRLKGGPYSFWRFHFEFLCLLKLVQTTEVQYRSSPIVRIWDQKKSVENLSDPEGEDVDFTEDSYDLGLAPRAAHAAQNWCNLAPTGRSGATNWDICDSLDKTQLIYSTQ